MDGRLSLGLRGLALDTKKDGGLLPILDLRGLNHFLVVKFKMLTFSVMLPFLELNIWFTVLDLKDSYFHVSIHPEYHKFLCFKFMR